MVPIYGGQSYERQYRALHAGAQVVAFGVGRFRIEQPAEIKGMPGDRGIGDTHTRAIMLPDFPFRFPTPLQNRGKCHREVHRIPLTVFLYL